MSEVGGTQRAGAGTGADADVGTAAGAGVGDAAGAGVGDAHGMLEVSGTALHLRQWGRDGDPVVLFVHQLGIAGSSLHLAEVAALLASGYGLRVLAPDLPGFGGSPAWPAERYDPRALADLLLDLLDVLGLAQVSYVGLSWGATLGCHLAGRAPERVRTLALLDAGHIDAGDQESFDAEAALRTRVRAAARQLDAFRFRRLEDALNTVSDDYPRWTPELERSWTTALRRSAGRVRPRLTAPVYGGAVHGLAVAPPSTTWSAIAAAGMPVLLLTADEPPEVRTLQEAARGRFAAAIPVADVRVVPGQRHDLVAGMGPELAAVLGDWLAAHGVVGRATGRLR